VRKYRLKLCHRDLRARPAHSTPFVSDNDLLQQMGLIVGTLLQPGCQHGQPFTEVDKHVEEEIEDAVPDSASVAKPESPFSLGFAKSLDVGVNADEPLSIISLLLLHPLHWNCILSTSSSPLPPPTSSLYFKHRTSGYDCEVLFAKEFHSLRILLPRSDDEISSSIDFARSLSRLDLWDPHGGKSKVDFSKTADDRYILKQMSWAEAQSSIEFIPNYIKYVTEAHKQQKPTVLAKILGIYRIMQDGTKRDVMIMENLLYDRAVRQIFDLKGSVGRSYSSCTSTTRSSSAAGDVMYDEHLIEAMEASPFYVRDKSVLRDAIQNDTAFLAENGIVDYSLLLGIDEAKQELVVGVIDYIRTFTWDKWLEMHAKQLLLGCHNLPTVIWPESYQHRFSQAMDRYFFQDGSASRHTQYTHNIAL